MRDDGSVVIALVVRDGNGDPIVVPVIADTHPRQNVILSVYGKEAHGDATGFDWIEAQILAAQKRGEFTYKRMDFADSVPKPESAVAISSSPGLIPVDGPAKPTRPILTARSKVKDS